jgi:hypothetical protein
VKARRVLIVHSYQLLNFMSPDMRTTVRQTFNNAQVFSRFCVCVLITSV